MPKAFARIPASLIEVFLETGDIPEKLTEALEQAVKDARDDLNYGGEAPIQVFITDDSDDEEEDQ